MKALIKRLFASALLVSAFGCGHFSSLSPCDGDSPRWLEIHDSVVVSISPYDGSRDSIAIHYPLTSVACMSSGFAAGFAEIGATEVVTAVSGLKYISNPLIREHAKEIGNDASPDYEMLLSLKPDLVLAYSVGAVMPMYVEKLRTLGVPVLVLYDYLETTPLARSAYMRAYGVMCGRTEQADSVYAAVTEAYSQIRSRIASGRESSHVCNVLMNSPLGDAWYIPGRDSYMYTLVHDAGGSILGSQDGVESSVISIESAMELGRSADVWLNPGTGARPGRISVAEVWDNSLHVTPGGGNDFWERGAVRPDLILSDLAAIFGGSPDESSMNFYRKL